MPYRASSTSLHGGHCDGRAPRVTPVNQRASWNPTEPRDSAQGSPTQQLKKKQKKGGDRHTQPRTARPRQNSGAAWERPGHSQSRSLGAAGKPRELVTGGRPAACGGVARDAGAPAGAGQVPRLNSNECLPRGVGRRSRQPAPGTGSSLHPLCAHQLLPPATAEQRPERPCHALGLVCAVASAHVPNSATGVGAQPKAAISPLGDPKHILSRPQKTHRHSSTRSSPALSTVGAARSSCGGRRGHGPGAYAARQAREPRPDERG